MAKNIFLVTGRMGNDVELKVLESGKAVCNFSIAESYPTSKKDENSKTVYETRWHDVTAWDGLAKKLEKLAKKGSVIQVTGRLEYDHYEKNGVEIKRAKVVADELEVYNISKQQSTAIDSIPF